MAMSASENHRNNLNNSEEVFSLAKDSDGYFSIDFIQKNQFFFGELIVLNPSKSHMTIVKFKTTFPAGVAAFGGSNYIILDPKTKRRVYMRLRRENLDLKSGFVKMESRSINIRKVPTTQFSPIHLWQTLPWNHFDVEEFRVAFQRSESSTDDGNGENGQHIENGQHFENDANRENVVGMQPNRQNSRTLLVRCMNQRATTSLSNSEWHPSDDAGLPTIVEGKKEVFPTKAKIKETISMLRHQNEELCQRRELLSKRVEDLRGQLDDGGDDEEKLTEEIFRLRMDKLSNIIAIRELDEKIEARQLVVIGIACFLVFVVDMLLLKLLW